MIAPRLLSPDEAATFLALGSRWSVYRLIRRGELPVVRIAGKLRVDVVDLERLIEAAKQTGGNHVALHRTTALAAVPRELTPARPRSRVTVARSGDSRGTTPTANSDQRGRKSAVPAAPSMRNAVCASSASSP
jgi:excisionase family DNA binding protein